jgi:hypothetical protein
MDSADKEKDVQIEDAHSGDSTHAVDHSELYNDRMTWQAFMAIVASGSPRITVISWLTSA